MSSLLFVQCRGVLFRVFGGEGTFFGEEDEDEEEEEEEEEDVGVE